MTTVYECYGQVYVGASINFGHLNGVATKIQKCNQKFTVLHTPLISAFWIVDKIVQLHTRGLNCYHLKLNSIICALPKCLALFCHYQEELSPR